MENLIKNDKARKLEILKKELNGRIRSNPVEVDNVYLSKVKKMLHENYEYLDACLTLFDIQTTDVDLALAFINTKTKIVYVDKDMFGYLTDDLQLKVIIHEYFHYLYDTVGRSEPYKGMSHNVINICADAEINSAIGLTEIGINNENFMECISGGKTKQSLPVETAFEEYLRICQGIQNDKDKGQGNQNRSQGNQNQSQGNQNQSRNEESIRIDLDIDLNQDANQSVEDKIKGDLERSQIIQSVLNSNNVPGSISQKLEHIIKNEVKVEKRLLWDKVLRGIITQDVDNIISGNAYTSYTVFNRYYVNMKDGVVHPGEYDMSYEYHLGVILDVSGSMCDQLDYMLSVLKSIGDIDESIILDVYLVDTEVLDVIYGLNNQTDLSKLYLKEGGGSDMEKGISVCLETNKDYDKIVVMTDGYTCWQDRPLSEKSKIVVLQFADEDQEVPYQTFKVAG